jgi:hypothetical protein
MSERPLYPSALIGSLHSSSNKASNKSDPNATSSSDRGYDGHDNHSSEFESQTSSEQQDTTRLQLQNRSRSGVSGFSSGVSRIDDGVNDGLNDDDSFLSWNNLTQSSSSRSCEQMRYGNTHRRARYTGDDGYDDDTYSEWSEGELSTEISRLYNTPPHLTSSSANTTLPTAASLSRPVQHRPQHVGAEDRHSMYSVDSDFAMCVDNGLSQVMEEEERGR